MSLLPDMSDATAAKKYNFRNSFDANERGMVAARDFTLADMEKARVESFAEGKVAGAEEARASLAQATANALDAIGSGLRDLRADMDSIRSSLEAEAVDSVLSIARKLVPHYARTHGMDEIEGVVRECLASVYDEPRVVVRASDTVLDQIKANLDGLIASSGFGGKVVLFADPTLSESDCRIEWADGGTERDMSRLWQDIEDNISRILGRDSVSTGVDSPADGNNTI
jgi:flagellar assembly protein FliH